MPAKNKLEVIIISDYSHANSLAITRKTNSLKRADSTKNAIAIIDAAFSMIETYLSRIHSAPQKNGSYTADGAYESYRDSVHADVLAFLRSDEEDGEIQSLVLTAEGKTHRSFFSFERVAIHNS